MSKKILIIEDNETYSEILAKKLSLNGFQVDIASDGMDGIDKAINSNHDIIIIDLLLPKINGIQVMEEIRKSELGKTAQIIILSNINPDGEIQKSIDKNKPVSYLIKPQVTIDDILIKINSILQ